MKTYIAFWVGGKRDGEILGIFSNVADGINFVSAFENEHESEFDPVYGGVAIVDELGMDVEW